MRAFRFSYTLVLAFLVALAAPVAAPVAQADTTAVVPPSQSFAGGYLAGRFAQRHQDWAAAQSYMGTALSHDAENAQLEQRTFLLALGAGNFSAARPLAKKITTRKDGIELASIFLASDALARDDYAGALAYLERLPAGGFGQYTKPVLTAWALAGQGDKDAVKKLLASFAGEKDAAYHVHAGLIETFAGNMNAADAYFQTAMKSELDFHTAVMIADFYERYGRPDIVRGIYAELDRAYPFNPYVAALAARDPTRRIDPAIVRPAHGAAVALLDLATMLYNRRAYDSAQIYGNLVRLMNPDATLAKMMMGDIAAMTGQYTRALDNYASVDKRDPAFAMAQMRRAEVLDAQGKTQDALAVLEKLSRNPANRVQALTSLGDTYRRHNMFDKAVTVYDRALAGLPPSPSTWAIVYARGVSLSHVGRWDDAERDLLQALSFQPENPMILNFLAYNWADRGINLDRALAYVQSAAALSPDDGYILDSYGWTLFRMGRYDEAITWLEMAQAQMPNDSAVIDHLGDAYWQANRKDEARYQWRRADDMSRDDNFKKTVQQKIMHGITVPAAAALNQARF